MRYYISFILFSLFAVTFSSCNTDDLEKDIDALKDRVTSFETQVQQLNDEMNIIRVALDGNKTITDYSINGDTYTLTLSNGETLTLTPGVVGGNYPSIEIGENGNWVIGGVDTGWRAEATDGEDSTITPKFKIEANPADGGKKYWWVSYDEGTTWSVLVNGLAEGVNTNTNPISGAEVVGDNFKVTINNQDYFIPIVKNLVCAINLSQDVVTDGLWSVASGGASTFTVKVNLADGDLVRVKAPVDWNAKLSNYGGGTTEITVTVTPPATPSECTIVVEVTHGVNTAVDQIKARTTSNSYWAEYNAGFDLTIGDVVINKYDNPGGQLLQNGAKISANGIYFLAAESTVDWTGGASSLIVFAEKKDETPSVNIATGNGLINFTGVDDKDTGVLFKGIKLCRNSEMTSAYWFNTSADKTTKRLFFERCVIQMKEGKSFSYFSGGGNIENIMFESCRISIPAQSSPSGTTNLVNCNKGSYNNVVVRNNVFHCTTPDKQVYSLIITAPDVISVANISVNNNTFINVLSNHGTSSGFVKLRFREGWAMKSNLFWYDTEYIVPGNGTDVTSLMAALPGDVTFNTTDFTGNKVFTALDNTGLKWQYFRTVPGGFKDNALTVEKVNPFVDLSDTEGKYTLKPEYQGIGATIN